MVKRVGWVWAAAVGGVILSGVGGCNLSQPPKAYRPSSTSADEDAPTAAAGTARAANVLTPAAGSSDATLAETAKKSPVDPPPSAEVKQEPTRRDIQVMSPERLQLLKPMALPPGAKLPPMMMVQPPAKVTASPPVEADALPVQADAPPVAPAP
jgi:hypothetical protein